MDMFYFCPEKNQLVLFPELPELPELPVTSF